MFTYPIYAPPSNGLPSGLILHLDGANPGETTPTQWDDISGSNNHFRNTNAAEQPIFANDEVEFGASSGVYLYGTHNLQSLGLTEAELFIVQKRDPAASVTGSDTGWIYFGPENFVPDFYTHNGIITTNVFCQAGPTTNIDPATVSVDVDTYHIVNVSNGSNGRWEFRLNGLLGGERDLNTLTFRNSVPLLGLSEWTGGYGVRYFKGVMKEVLLFNRKLTTEERAEVNAYLNAKI